MASPAERPDHGGTHQRALVAAVAEVLARLDAHAGTPGQPRGLAAVPADVDRSAVPDPLEQDVRAGAVGPAGGPARPPASLDPMSVSGPLDPDAWAGSADPARGPADVPASLDPDVSAGTWGPAGWPAAPPASLDPVAVSGPLDPDAWAGSADPARVPADASASVDPAAAPAPSGPAARAGPEPALDGMSALDTVCGCFGLTEFERAVLVLTAAVEIDPTAAARCAAASADQRGYPTFALALAALPDPHWSALAPVAALRRWRLVELEEGGPVTASRLRIDERILHFLTGVPYLDTRLHGLARRIEPAPGLPPSQCGVAGALAASWAASGPAPHAELSGGDGPTRQEIAASAARSAGLLLYAVAEADLPTEPAERDALARLWEREAILLPAALLVEAGGPAPDRLAALDGFAAGLGVPLVVSSTDPLPVTATARARFAVPGFEAAEQRSLWAAVLNGTGSGHAGGPDGGGPPDGAREPAGAGGPDDRGVPAGAREAAGGAGPDGGSAPDDARQPAGRGGLDGGDAPAGAREAGGGGPGGGG